MNVNAMMININLPQRVVLGIGTGLAVLVFITLVYSVSQWHADWVLAHQETATAPTITATDETASMIAAIPSEHLFGKNFSKAGDVPITSLQLRVTGIVKVENEAGNNVSKAYISIAGAPSKIYQIGDSLPYGVKVYDITPNIVILENDGHLEKLPLPREELHFKPRDQQEPDER